MKYSIKKNPYSFLEVSPKPSEKFLKEIYSKKYFKNKLSACYSRVYSIDELQNRIKKFDLYIDIAVSKHLHFKFNLNEKKILTIRSMKGEFKHLKLGKHYDAKYKIQTLSMPKKKLNLKQNDV